MKTAVLRSPTGWREGAFRSPNSRQVAHTNTTSAVTLRGAVRSQISEPPRSYATPNCGSRVILPQLMRSSDNLLARNIPPSNPLLQSPYHRLQKHTSRFFSPTSYPTPTRPATPSSPFPDPTSSYTPLSPTQQTSIQCPQVCCVPIHSANHLVQAYIR